MKEEREREIRKGPSVAVEDKLMNVVLSYQLVVQPIQPFTYIKEDKINKKLITK